jgi:hypothetical protein
MAEIPVERKKRTATAAAGGAAPTRKGLPWWLFPLIALLLLIPLLFLLARGCDGYNAGVVSNANNGNGNRGNVAETAAAVNGGNRSNANALIVITNDNDNSIVRSTTNNDYSGNENRAANSGASAITDTSYFAGVNDKQTLVGRTAEFDEARVRRVVSDRVFTVRSGGGEMYVLLDEGLDSGGGSEQKVKIRPGQKLNLSGEFRQVPTEETNAEREKDLSGRDFERMKNQKVYLHATSVKNS